MAQLNTYDDYKTGTTAEEQSKLVETGKVVFSGKTTDNGDYQTKSVALSELMSTSSGGGGGGLTLAQVDPVFTEGNIKRNWNDTGWITGQIHEVHVQNGVFARTAVIDPAIASEDYDDCVFSADNVCLRVIIDNYNKTTDASVLLNVVVEITDIQPYGYNPENPIKYNFIQVKDSAGNDLTRLYSLGAVDNVASQDYIEESTGFPVHARPGMIDGNSAQIHILGNMYRVFDDYINTVSGES